MNFTGDDIIGKPRVWQRGSARMKGAAGAFVTAGIISLVIPASRMEAFLVATGLSETISGGLPLSVIERLVIALVCGLVAGALALIFLRGFRFGSGADDNARIRDFSDLPRLRSADAHPDAPARRPLFAAEDLADPMPLSAWLEHPQDGSVPENSPASSDEPEVIFEETGIADTVRLDAPQTRTVRSLLDTDLASLPIGELVDRLEHSLAALKAPANLRATAAKPAVGENGRADANDATPRAVKSSNDMDEALKAALATLQRMAKK